MREITSERTGLDYLTEQRYWLVPLENPDSKCTVSVEEVLPIELWDRSVSRLIWDPCRTPNHLRSGPQVPVTSGAARIRLHPPCVTTSLPEDRIAVVVFGVVRHYPDEDATEALPWCLLVKDDGVLGLEQHRTAQVPFRHAFSHSSLSMGGGVVLHASIAIVYVSGVNCNLLRLWTSGYGDDSFGESTEITTAHNSNPQ
jgi:hypothetical protein